MLRHLARRPPPSKPFHLNARPFQLNAGAVRVHVSAPKPEPPRPRRLIRRNVFYGSLTAMALQSDHRPSVMARQHFHTTSRRQAIPFLGLAGLLKASTILEVIRAVGRVTLTFVPFVLFKNMVSRKYLKKVDQFKENHPDQPLPFHGGDESKYAAKREWVIQGIRRRTIIFHLLMFAPFALFALAIAASIERTPLTGRWRTILLSPEEEEVISQQLAGDGWYRAVAEILAREGVPKLIPPSDLRYQWVYTTLRQLEGIIPALGEEEALAPDWYTRGDDDSPLPPPAEYPLRPRPRASETIRLFRCSVTGDGPLPGVASHHIPGPPYSLLVIDDPESCNAFSYGFGPDGAGGIVVFSGFLDRIMRDNPCPPPPPEPSSSSWLSSLLGGNTPTHTLPTPTPEQTADLAVLLSHELSHLILAHHLETLSSSTVLVPGVFSIFSDVLRTLLFPITALMGPFVNDALASLGAAGSIEMTRCGEFCTTMAQEIEADVVSARLLAYAGFDPRRAVHFWESREDQCVPGAGQSVQEERERRQLAHERHVSSAMRLFGDSHPINEVRGQRLRQELARWREERDRRLEQLRRLQEP
ncbi:hypothetical protein PENSPDRAFT_653322 [Peniophora sp. CONT]|nr:hypothetical protein PENSPDRAFT_653322 [Peniophora sp. CONT]